MNVYIDRRKLKITEKKTTIHTVPMVYTAVRSMVLNGFRIKLSIMNTACQDNSNIAVNAVHRAKL